MSGDGLWGTVTLLLHGNGVNGSTTMVDSSLYRNAVVAKGDAKISAAQSKFGGGSLFFDGSGDYLSCSKAPLEWGSGVVGTIEAWVYPTAYPSSGNFGCICAIGSPGAGAGGGGLATGGVSFHIDSAGKLSLWAGDLAVSGSTAFNYIISAGVVPLNTWTHVEFDRASTPLLFINGVSQTLTTYNGTSLLSVTFSEPDVSEMRVGAQQPLGSNAPGYFTGYIGDLRLTKGVTRNAANFTPPAAWLPEAPDWWGAVRHGERASARAMTAARRYTGARPVPRSRTRADNSAGPGSLVGTVKVDTLPVSRKVRLFDVASGRLLKEMWSDKAGVYRFDGLALDRPYTVLSHDHQRDYNATVADYVYAEVLP